MSAPKNPTYRKKLAIDADIANRIRSTAELDIREAEAVAYFARVRTVERNETTAFQKAAIRTFQRATL
jgi:hypothetical protein